MEFVSVVCRGGIISPTEQTQARYTELAGLGHFLLMEDPTALAKHIRAFIEAVL